MPAFLDANNLQLFVGEDLRGVLEKVVYEDNSGKENEGFQAELADMYNRTSYNIINKYSNLKYIDSHTAKSCECDSIHNQYINISK